MTFENQKIGMGGYIETLPRAGGKVTPLSDCPHYPATHKGEGVQSPLTIPMKYTILTKADGVQVTVEFVLADVLADTALTRKLIEKGITSETYGGAQKAHLIRYAKAGDKAAIKEGKTDLKDVKERRLVFTLEELLALSVSRSSGVTAEYVDAAIKALAKLGNVLKLKEPASEHGSKATQAEKIAIAEPAKDKLKAAATKWGAPQVFTEIDGPWTVAAVARLLRWKADKDAAEREDSILG